MPESKSGALTSLATPQLFSIRQRTGCIAEERAAFCRLFSMLSNLLLHFYVWQGFLG
jgi:hypothetical protein